MPVKKFENPWPSDIQFCIRYTAFHSTCIYPLNSRKLQSRYQNVPRDGTSGLFALRSLTTYIPGRINKFQMVYSYITEVFIKESAKTCFYQLL